MANCTILAEHLKANGHENSRVSREIVKEFQQFIKPETKIIKQQIW